jgi:hypothetical protein
MGTIQCGINADTIDVDDTSLAHLHIVINRKLRDTPAFTLTVFSVPGDDIPVRLWVERNGPLFLTYTSREAPRINERWIDELLASSSGPDGLVLTLAPALT